MCFFGPLAFFSISCECVVFLESCLHPYSEDGNSVLNSLLIPIEELTSTLDLNCNE